MIKTSQLSKKTSNNGEHMSLPHLNYDMRKSQLILKKQPPDDVDL
jgi:hypothetical protein